jgi:hypothetical protein
MSQQLDTRDLAERLEELGDLRIAHEDAIEAHEEAETALENYLRNREETDEPTPHEIELRADLQAAVKEMEDTEMEDEDADELEELENLKEEVGREWDHGVQLIPEDDFVDYCQELCEDIGDLPKDLPGYIVIDWDATSNNLRQDYSETTFRGETYLFRA